MTLDNLRKLEKIVNSELTSKIKSSIIENNEFLIEINESDLVDVVQFLKSNESCKFRQLIDIAGVDYPEDEKRFRLVYLFLSHENNNRIKLIICFDSSQIISSITKISFKFSENFLIILLSTGKVAPSFKTLIPLAFKNSSFQPSESNASIIS